MKVVHVIEALGGGVYTYFKDLSHFMGQAEISEKIETFIVFSNKRKEIIPENIYKEFSKNVTLIPLEMERELNLFKDLKATFQLKKLFGEINPDVIHLHSSKAGVIGRWANFLTLSKRKIFYTPHGYAFLRQDISGFKRNIYRIIERYTQLFFGGTTIACGDTEYKIAKSLGKAELVRNGIDFEKISSYFNYQKPKKLTFGIVGRITPQKNPKLFNEIAKKFPEYDFIWIGDGELNHEITAPNIKITGWFYSNDVVYNWLNHLDVFLQTSLWEGLPLAVLEAMALKKPIVATNVIGNKDIVVTNENGFLFNEIKELETIFKKLENDSFRNRISENVYLCAKDNFDMNKNFKKLLVIYKS